MGRCVKRVVDRAGRSDGGRGGGKKNCRPYCIEARDPAEK